MADGSVTIDFKGDTKNLEKDISGIGSKVKSGFSKIGSIAGSAAKGVVTAVGAASTAIGGLVAASVNAYADYEQLVGGVDTLFKTSSEKVQAYADNAYKTAGMSANQYMETVTGFSASLLQSLGGDTEKAADYANRAITDMSDNANKMGTSMELIQNAYQGFAKQNYTMLDNLKLGYGGTKEEMARLIQDASKMKDVQQQLGVTVDANSLSFGNIVNAISVMQQSMGIAGTTSKEASTTIEGSINSVKAAWENLLVGISNPDADWDKLIQDLVDTVSTAGENLLSVVGSALVGVSALIRDLFPQIAAQIPSLITEILPQLIDTGINVVNSLIIGIQENLPALTECAMQLIINLGNGIIQMLPQILQIAIQLIQSFINGIIQMLPQIIQMGIQLITQLITGIAQMSPTLISQALNCIITIVQGLLDNVDLIIDAGIQLIIGLAEGLINAIPTLVEKIPTIIEKIIEAIIQNLPKITVMGIRLIVELGAGLIAAIPQLIGMIPQIIKAIIDAFKNTDWGAVGKDLLNGLLEGFSNAGNIIWEAIKKVGNSMIDGIKSFFGIHSPSRVFAELGEYLPQGFAVGIDADASQAVDSIDEMNKDVINSMNLDGLYEKMQNAVNFAKSRMTDALNTSVTSNRIVYADITMNPADVYMDSTKVGRMVTPTVTRTLKEAGIR